MFCQACSPEDADQIARDGWRRSGDGAQGLQGAPAAQDIMPSIDLRGAFNDH